MAVCCGNCRKHIRANFVAIRCLMLKCWQLRFIKKFAMESDTVLCCTAGYVILVSVVVIVSVNVTVDVTAKIRT